MSYILEALKKSEAARQREASATAPILRQSVRPAVSPKPAIHGIGLIIPAVIICICVLAAGYFFFFQSQQKTVVHNASSTMPRNKADQSSHGATNSVSQTDKSIPEFYPNKKTAIYPHTPTANDEILEPAPLETTLPPRQEMSAPSIQQPAPTLPHLEELAPSLQESIPDLQLAGHVFSAAPHLRMIVINNAIVRENDAVAQNLVLEEITRQGIILRSGNTRFRLDVQ